MELLMSKDFLRLVDKADIVMAETPKGMCELQWFPRGSMFYEVTSGSYKLALKDIKHIYFNSDPEYYVLEVDAGGVYPVNVIVWLYKTTFIKPDIS